MSRISVFLILMILSLHVFPCADVQVSDGCVSEPYDSHHADGGHEEEQPIDDCSPFCSCVCCHVVSMIQANKLEFKEQIGFVFEYTYLESIPVSILQNIWRPPKSII